MAQQSLSLTVDAIHQGIEQDLHIGAQLYVSYQGETIADMAIGEAQLDMPMTTSTLMPWYSSSKPLTAIVIAQLWEQNRLGLDDPVAHHIPEFAKQHKHAITIRHLLTHTGGFRSVAGIQWHSDPWHEIITKICAAPLERDWTPGQKAGYHLASSWFILGEIAQRIDGRPLSQIIHKDICNPLGLQNTYMGIPSEKFATLENHLGHMHNAPETYAYWNTAEGSTLSRPGGGGRGPIRELGKFYESLLNPDSPILKPETIAAFTRRHRKDMFDETFKHVIDWGLGFIVNSNHHGPRTIPYGYGLHASPNTFGHGGIQSSAGFADPEHNLVVAIVCNGMPGEPKHNRRARILHTAIYEDLDLS